MPYHLITVFQLRSGYNNIHILYTKILSLLSDLITDVRNPVFEKRPALREHFQVQKAFPGTYNHFTEYRYGYHI